MAVRLWMSPRDVCALLAASTALRLVRMMLGQHLGVSEHSRLLRFAMALLRRFYRREFETCSRTAAASGDPDEHRLVKVPEAVYELLKVLGFCVFQGPAGKQLLFDADGTPVCAQGYFRSKLAHPQVWGMTPEQRSRQAEQQAIFRQQVATRKADEAKARAQKASDAAAERQRALEDARKKAEEAASKRLVATKEAIESNNAKKLELAKQVAAGRKWTVKEWEAFQTKRNGNEPLHDAVVHDVLTTHTTTPRMSVFHRLVGSRRAQIEQLEKANQALQRQLPTSPRTLPTAAPQPASPERRSWRNILRHQPSQLIGNVQASEALREQEASQNNTPAAVEARSSNPQPALPKSSRGQLVYPLQHAMSSRQRPAVVEATSSNAQPVLSMPLSSPSANDPLSTTQKRQMSLNLFAPPLSTSGPSGVSANHTSPKPASANLFADDTSAGWLKMCKNIEAKCLQKCNSITDVPSQAQCHKNCENERQRECEHSCEANEGCQ